MLAEIRKELFQLVVRRRPQRDPFYYLLGGFSLNPYIAREYAPAEQRAAAMLRACEAGPAFYQQAAAQLEPALPAAALQVGLMMSGGAAEFVKGDAKKAFADLPDAELRGKLEGCLDRLAGEIATFQGALKSRMPAATQEFRLGAETLVAMLKATEGIEIDVPRLTELARADYERNKLAIEKAAHEMDPKRDAAAVIAEVSSDKPAADRVVEEATGQVELLSKLIADKQIISVPRPDKVLVRTEPAVHARQLRGVQRSGSVRDHAAAELLLHRAAGPDVAGAAAAGVPALACGICCSSAPTRCCPGTSCRACISARADRACGGSSRRTRRRRAGPTTSRR